MPVFVIVDITIHDPATYERYKAMAPSSIFQYGGRYAVRGASVTTLEGTWCPERFVLLEFPTADAAKTWWTSAEYAPAKALRQASARTEMLLVDGPALEKPA